MKTRIVIVLGLATVLAGTAIGQLRYKVPYATSVITGQPYSAEEVEEWKQTLSDGTQITHPTSNFKIFRDSAGRTRTERRLIVEIDDVVAGYRYILDLADKVAHRSAILPRPAAAAVERPATSKAADGPRPEYTNESLGTQVIEGLTCERRKGTLTYPIGTIGNDRPIVSTTENWTSQELRIVVLSKISDIRSGDRIVQLKNINRANPEYSLFQPPPDYKVVDQTGPFELVINLP